MSTTSGENPGARDETIKRIVARHASGHDALDDYFIPRYADGEWFTLAERIDKLASRPAPRPEITEDMVDRAFLAMQDAGRPASRNVVRRALTAAFQQEPRHA